MKYGPHYPNIGKNVFIARSADVIGQVTIGDFSNIWFQTLIRGDVNTIEIGQRTNIQDQSCLHVTGKTANLRVGDDVTVGHQVLLHGCKIGNRVLIGMGSVIMDNAEIPEESIVGAGSLITENKKFPPGHLILGRPAKVIRPLTKEELDFLVTSAKNYVETAAEYLKA